MVRVLYKIAIYICRYVYELPRQYHIYIHIQSSRDTDNKQKAEYEKPIIAFIILIKSGAA